MTKRVLLTMALAGPPLFICLALSAVGRFDELPFFGGIAAAVSVLMLIETFDETEGGD